MKEDIIHERYRELACASIQQGINDWLRSNKSPYVLYKWLNECDWFDFLNLDREYFYVKVLELKEKGITSVNMGSRYGKKRDL